MKKLLLLFIILLALPFVHSQAQWQTQIQSLCQNNVCLEGNPAIWRMQISNQGDQDLNFQQIVFRDDLNLVFASRTFKQNELVVPKGKYQIVDIQGNVPAASKGSLVYFTVSYVMNGKVYNDNIRATKIMPLNEIECLNHDYCSKDRLCIGYRCVPENLVNISNLNITRHSINKNNPVGFTEVMLVVIVSLLILIFVKINNKK